MSCHPHFGEGEVVGVSDDAIRKSDRQTDVLYTSVRRLKLKYSAEHQHYTVARGPSSVRAPELLALSVLGDIADKQFRLLRLHRSVVWSVCLSVTFVHCVQTAEDINKISFAYRPTTAPCLSQIALKFGLHRITISSPNFSLN